MVPGALTQVAEDAAVAGVSFLYLLVMFSPLEKAYPARTGQAFFRPGWSTDLAFFLGQYLLWLGLVFSLFAELSPWLHGLVPPGFRRAFATQPVVLQLFEVVVLGDLLIYWAHRLQHRVDLLWRFHAVHHSAEHLDWLAAHREHPVDTVYSMAVMNLPAMLIGLGPQAMASFLAFRGLWAIFIHSNVRVELGWFGLLVGSPAFHHWHHARDRHACNYGNVSPLMDVLFGTHYDPGREPEALGLEHPLGQSYLALLARPLWPGWPEGPQPAAAASP